MVVPTAMTRRPWARAASERRPDAGVDLVGLAVQSGRCDASGCSGLNVPSPTCSVRSRRATPASRSVRVSCRREMQARRRRRGRADARAHSWSGIARRRRAGVLMYGGSGVSPTSSRGSSSGAAARLVSASGRRPVASRSATYQSASALAHPAPPRDPACRAASASHVSPSRSRLRAARRNSTSMRPPSRAGRSSAPGTRACRCAPARRLARSSAGRSQNDTVLECPRRHVARQVVAKHRAARAAAARSAPAGRS